MRKLSGVGGEERVGVLAFEVAALMSRTATLWRALGDAQVARLRGEAVRLEGVRRLVADDDAALLALALAEMADACRGLSRSVAGLSSRCADPLLRRFAALFAALLARGADPHGLLYAAARKMDRKARKMQRLVATTALLCQELDVLAELEQSLRPRRRGAGAVAGENARRIARQRQDVDALRAASLWNRTFDYAVRLLARSLFTIVARIIEVFGLEAKNLAVDEYDDATVSFTSARLSWSSSFVGSMNSLVFPSDFTKDTARKFLAAKSTKINGDVRQFLMSRSQSLRQLRWSSAGSHLMGCVVARSRSPVRERWLLPLHGGGHDLDAPLSFSYVSASNDDDLTCSVVDYHSSHSQDQDHTSTTTKLSTSVFEPSHNAVANASEATLGAAALALHYAHIIIFVEKLAVAPHRISPDERDALYGMLTGSIRASLRARLKPPHAKKTTSSSSSSSSIDPILAAEWRDTVRRILAWLAPLAHNMVRWQSERSFEQRNVASSTGVLLLQTLHFADRRKAEAAVTELLVGLNYVCRSARELDTTRTRETK